jgi:hypothetical protein
MNDPQPASPELRTCGNCACSEVIIKPKVQPASVTPAEFDAMPVRQMVCRLNPPLVVQTPKGRALMQMPTDEKMVCWHWKAPGTAPGL